MPSEQELELVADFVASRIFRAAFAHDTVSEHAQSRVPSTLASIERRWFAGRQTKRSADLLASRLLDVQGRAEVTEHFALIGTVALLQLARAGHRIILVKEPRAAADRHLEVSIHIPTTRRGRPKKDASAEARSNPSRLYFVSPAIAAACERALEMADPRLIHAVRLGTLDRGRWSDQPRPQRMGSAYYLSDTSLEKSE